MRKAAFAISAILATTMLTGMAVRHLRLTDSYPKADQSIDESPSELRVWFNQETSLAVSRLGLEGPSGAIDVGSVEATDDPKSFKAPIKQSLQPGKYSVSWRTAGDDGHVQRGAFSFTLGGSGRR